MYKRIFILSVVIMLSFPAVCMAGETQPPAGSEEAGGGTSMPAVQDAGGSGPLGAVLSLAEAIYETGDLVRDVLEGAVSAAACPEY